MTDEETAAKLDEVEQLLRDGRLATRARAKDLLIELTESFDSRNLYLRGRFTTYIGILLVKFYSGACEVDKPRAVAELKKSLVKFELAYAQLCEGQVKAETRAERELFGPLLHSCSFEWAVAYLRLKAWRELDGTETMPPSEHLKMQSRIHVVKAFTRGHELRSMF